ncbi:MAG: GntR family transcriptional regulator, partial [Opitutaceae bacterium]|nr:GntR family transcriptional regulator [Opitutaceae bacterium]
MGSEADKNGNAASHWDTQIRNIILDRDNGVLLHAQLRNSLRRLIENAPEKSSKLPPESELVKLLNVAPSTVRKALDGLVTEGLIQRRRSIGTVIKPRSGAHWLKNISVIMPNYPSHTISAHLSALTRQMGLIGGKVNIITLGRGDDWRSCSQQLDFSPAEGGVVFFNHFSTPTLIDLHNTLQRQGYRTVLLGHLRDHGVPLAQVEVRTDLGTGFDGDTVHYRPDGFHRSISAMGALHRFNPPARPNANADVESSHATIEPEFFDLE